MFGMMNDLEDDPYFGHHMRSMRQMNNMMNSLFSDPFGMIGGLEGIAAAPFGGGRSTALMPFMPPSVNMNRLLSGGNDATSFCSSSVFSMTSGPDGPQVYQATSSTRTGPGGIKETRKTVQDSRTGTKKMAIGHHIGERAHIIEREQNVSTGSQEERQDFINLDDNDAEDFDREFQSKARSSMSLSGGRRSEQLALPSNQATSPPLRAIANEPYNGNSGHTTTSRPRHSNAPVGSYSAPIAPRRSIRSPTSSPLTLPSSVSPSGGNYHITTSVHPHPYSVSGRKNRALKGSSTTYQ